MSGTYKVTPFEAPRCPRTCLAVLGTLFVLFVAAAPFLFIDPASDDPAEIRNGGPVDAVVVLGGSPAVRLGAATDLLGQLDAPPPTLVLAVQYEPPVLRCGEVAGLPDVPVRCFSPAPATTSGEALWIAEEAARQGWDRAVVVTSDVHVTRARWLVEDCIDALSPDTEVLYRAADTRWLSLRGIWGMLTESASLVGTLGDRPDACR